VGLLMGATMEGTTPMTFFNVPALIIILAGTGGATLAAVGMERMKLVPRLYRRVLNAERPDVAGRVEVLVEFADRARREGLLALEDRLAQVDDQFTRKGLQLVVDGTDPELVEEILEAEVDGMAQRHKAAAAPFKQAGGFAPTMGIIGTVMGLVHVLENLSRPETLGPAISGAFIATLMGVGAANVVFLPIAHRLSELSKAEVELRSMTIEGILAVQAGENPRILRERLISYVPPDERAEADARGGASAEQAPVAAPVAAPIPEAA
jgi:chemotaxis protein MotA